MQTAKNLISKYIRSTASTTNKFIISDCRFKYFSKNYQLLIDKNVYLTFVSSMNSLKHMTDSKLSSILITTFENSNLTSDEFLQKVRTSN